MKIFYLIIFFNLLIFKPLYSKNYDENKQNFILSQDSYFSFENKKKYRDFNNLEVLNQHIEMLKLLKFQENSREKLLIN